MKSVAVRWRRLPIFVVLTFSCLSVLQTAAYAQPKDCRVILTEKISQGSGSESTTGFVDPKPEVEPLRSYVRGENFQMIGMTYNVKNLFADDGSAESNYQKMGGSRMSVGGKKGQHKQQEQKDKPQGEMTSVRNIIRENNPDWLAVQEVENVESGNVLMDAPELQGKYHFFLTEGNDPRGIDVGIFVKKSLPFKYRYESHKDLKWTDRWEQDGKTQEQTIALFSRDFPVLMFFPKEAKEDAKPILMIGIVHSKSKRDREDGNGKVIDRESVRWRTAQYQGIAKIVADYRAKYGQDIPFMIAGDFNTEVQHSSEVDPIRSVLRSAFDIEEGQKDRPEDRGTHAYFPKGGKPERDQIDDVRLGGKGVRILEAQVLDYEDANGKKIEWPSSYGQREKQGSDHKAVRVDMILKEN